MAIEAGARLIRWLFDEALPFWAHQGIDRAGGGFHERFSPDGRTLADPRRARVAGRQIYAFAVAKQLGWQGPARAIVRHGLAFLQRHLCEGETLVVPVVDMAPGGPARSGFDLYDQAFVLFGLAAAASIGEQPVRQCNLARRLRDRMMAGWKHPLAGFEESVPRSLPLKANPHMHMLEAALAWSELDPAGGWDAIADEIVELCLARFLNPDNGSLREYFDGDWRFIDEHEAAVVEPGHQFEWAWLLIRWGTDRGRRDAIAAARRLIDLAETHGVSSVHKLAINELEPGLAVRSAKMRLWPQTERIKAHVARITIARDEAERADAEAAAQGATEGLLRFFAHPVRGLWWEHHDSAGQPISEPARASSLYHIMCAASVLSGVREPAL